MAEEGFFLGLGPWPSVDIDMGLLAFYPPQYYTTIGSIKNKTMLLLLARHSLKSYYDFCLKFVMCLYVRIYFPLPYVCLFLKKIKNK